MPDKATLDGQKYMNTLRAQALGVMAWVQSSMEEYMADGMRLAKVTVRGPDQVTGEILVVLHGVDEGGGIHVAFSSGPDVISAIASAKAKAESQGLRWRDDKPWPQAGG